MKETQPEQVGQGRTTVRTHWLYQFESSTVKGDDSEPLVVTHTGVQVTKDQADTLVKESGGIVSIDKEA